MEKIGRNDPCPCGSGKKFKKCCESKAIHHRPLKNTQVLPSSNRISSLFQKRTTTQPNDQLEK